MRQLAREKVVTRSAADTAWQDRPRYHVNLEFARANRDSVTWARSKFFLKKTENLTSRGELSAFFLVSVSPHSRQQLFCTDGHISMTAS